MINPSDQEMRRRELAVVIKRVHARSRKIVGWSINSNQTSKLVTDAIDMAINHRSPQSRIIHSDHGSQFISWAFSSRIKAAGLTPSMGSIGDGYDNAPMEYENLLPQATSVA